MHEVEAPPKPRISKLAVASLANAVLYPGFVTLIGYIGNKHLEFRDCIGCQPTISNTWNWIVILTVIWLFCMILILAAISKHKIRESQGELRGSLLATTTIVLMLAYVVITIGTVRITMGGPIAANEPSACGTLRTLSYGLQAYADAHPKEGYPATLTKLLQDPSSASGAETVRDRLHADATAHGYHFVYTPRSILGDQRLDAYEIVAEPVEPGKSGIRYFFFDQTGKMSHSYSRDGANRVVDYP